MPPALRHGIRAPGGDDAQRAQGDEPATGDGARFVAPGRSPLLGAPLVVRALIRPLHDPSNAREGAPIPRGAWIGAGAAGTDPGR